MFFKLNPSKFDLIYLRKSSRLIESLPSINILSNLSLAPSFTIHSLSLTFDSSLSLIPQIIFVAKSSFFHLRRIKQLKLFLDNPTLKLLVSSLICPALTIVTLYTMDSQRPRYTLSPKLSIALLAYFLVLLNFLVLLLPLSLYTGCLLKRSVFKICTSHV